MGCLVGRNFFGLPLTINMIRHHPIILLSPSEELLFVEQQDDAALAQFFADAASSDREAQFRAFETARKQLATK